ncbi:MAG: DUF6538 domain-containing protein [Desulfuromonadales bacterium]
MSFYIHKRNQTYYYRIKVPSDLSHLIPSREIKQSLKTSNIDAAKVAASGINAKVQTLFGLLRIEAIDHDQLSQLLASYLPRTRSFNVKAESGSAPWGRFYTLFLGCVEHQAV